MHLVLGQANDGGIRNISWLLKLCQLDRFIAVSYGAQQKFAVAIEKLIEEFGKAEQSRLAEKMPNLASVAGRCRDSKERKRLRELSKSILAQAKARDGPLSALSGTTAANRFFGQPHRDLFGWLIEKMPLPSRPRHKVQR